MAILSEIKVEELVLKSICHSTVKIEIWSSQLTLTSLSKDIKPLYCYKDRINAVN